MSDEEYTKFRLNLTQFSIELAGEKKFVEELYRKVYRDLLPLISSPAPTPAQSIDPQPQEPDQYPRLQYTWIYNCTQHYNKVYVVENDVLLHSAFGRFLNQNTVRRVYLDRHQHALFSQLAGGNHTLWAEITPEGRAMIEAAAQRAVKVNGE